MTEAQEKRFYFPLWNRACRANAWRMQKGRLELAENPPEPANTVISQARRLADQEHRAVTLVDLRHATHVVACGRDCSHSALRNRELTRWGWLARLLIDPDDLDAMNHWLHPELDEQESVEARIERVGRDAYRRGFGPGGPSRRSFVPLGDDDPCPIGKNWKGWPLKNLPSSFLDWFMGQEWRFKFPALVDYVERSRKAIDQDLKREGRI